MRPKVSEHPTSDLIPREPHELNEDQRSDIPSLANELRTMLESRDEQLGRLGNEPDETIRQILRAHDKKTFVAGAEGRLVVARFS